MDSPNPQHAATWLKPVTYALLIVFGIFLVGYFLLLWMTGAFLPPMSEDQARNLIQQAGGADKISREASKLINTHSTGGFYSLSVYETEITNFPAISVIATNSHTRSVVIEPGYQHLPMHIRILYGPHAHIKLMMIFDTTNGVMQQLGDSYVQLFPNIFFSK